MSTHPYRKRILKEYKELQKNLLPGIVLLGDVLDTSKFLFSIEIPPDQDGVLHSIYKDDKYILQFIITPLYPVDSPQVQFIIHNNSRIPMHPHIYSNGHICLDILGTGWTPACSMESILLSIQSMLSTNVLNDRPEGNSRYVLSAPLNPKKTSFVYDDDSV